MTEKFFLSSPIGLEKIAQQELEEIWPWLLDTDGRPHGEALTDLEIDKGGVQFSSSFATAVQVNYWHRSSLRLLWRVAEFRCRDFPKLFHNFKKLDLKQLIGSELAKDKIELSVSASRSRLGHEGRIAETCEKALGLKPPSGSSDLSVFIRIHDDLVTVSLDTTGKHLHFRHGDINDQEEKVKVGTASLRENLASGVMQFMCGTSPWVELSDVALMDPMVGSGTFLAEASSWAVPLKRSFDFQNWKRTPVLFRKAPLQKKSSGVFTKLYGADISTEVLNKAKARILATGTAEETFHLEKKDLFSDSGITISEKRRWVIANPPYGERLLVNFKPQELLERIESLYQPERLGILWSEKQAQTLKSEMRSLHLEKKLRFSNGGIPVEFQVWQNRN